MILRFILIFFFISFISCSKKENDIYEIKPKTNPYLIYEEAYKAFEKGDYFFAQKKFSEALDQLKLSYKLNSNDKTLCYNLAVVYDELNELKNSQNMFEKSLEIDPEYINANLGLAKNFEQQKNFDKAKFFFEKILRTKNLSPCFFENKKRPSSLSFMIFLFFKNF